MKTISTLGAMAGVVLAASLSACNAPPAASDAAKPAVDTAKIADAIKADVAQLVADYNAHDAVKTSSHDAPDVVAMGHGAPNDVGAAADLAGGKKQFADDPTTHVSVDNPTVDVAASGEMAVYRSTYAVTFVDPKTKKSIHEVGNYLAGYKKQADGSWKIAWSVVSDTPPAAPATPAKTS